MTSSLAIVAGVKEVSPAGGVKVYNFEVARDHTYFVQAHPTRGPPVAVHNADGYDELLDGAETITGYRAVSQAEWDDLVATGQFRPGPNGAEGKWFTCSEEQAHQFGELLQRTYSNGATYGIIRADIPLPAPGLHVDPGIDGIGGFFVENEALFSVPPIMMSSPQF